MIFSLDCTSDQMLQEQITQSKIPTSENNRNIFYKILIVDYTVSRFFQMSPTFWRVGAPGAQISNSWLEHWHYKRPLVATITFTHHHDWQIVDFTLTYCRLNQLPPYYILEDSNLEFRYFRLYDLDIPREKWLEQF